MIAKIGAGEIEDLATGRMGGKKCAEGMSANKRSQIAKKAAAKH